MKKRVVIIGGACYMLQHRDPGFLHPEDRGLWRAIRVEWDRRLGFWKSVDDDDYMIADDLRIVAKETGWSLGRNK